MKKLYNLLPLVILSAAHLNAVAVDVTFNITPARCGLNNGQVTAIADGGLPPYSYVWDDGPMTAARTDLAPGTYTVTVTDATGGTVQGTAEVEDLWELAPVLNHSGRSDCDGQCTGWIAVNMANLMGTAPYTSDHAPYFTDFPGYPNAIVFTEICGTGVTTLTISDANGCSREYDFIKFSLPTQEQDGFQALAACDGQNGAIVVTEGTQFGAPRLISVVPQDGGPAIEQYAQGQQEVVISGLAPGDYDVAVLLPNLDGEYEIPYCEAGTTITVEDLEGPCGQITGSVFNDADENCQQDPQDMGLPFRLMTVQPGDHHFFTGPDGTFIFNLAYGEYTLEQPLVEEEQICPVEVPVPFELDADAPSVQIDLADLSNVPHDLEISGWVSVLRPGFIYKARYTITNNSAFHSGNFTVHLSTDPVIPGSGQFEWNLAPLGPFTSMVVEYNAMLPADLDLLGTELTFTATVDNEEAEQNVLNNTLAITRTVTGSFDPNDKTGYTDRTQDATQFILGEDQWINYTIRFQNTGTDTAFTVVVSDELSEDLALPTLQILGASHDFVPSFGDARELIFTFNDIQLPDSTTNLLESQGYVNFRIRPVADIQVGDVIQNTAGIYFDFNDPVITNTTEHTVSVGTGVRTEAAADKVRVHPNPANDLLLVQLPEGADAAVRVYAVDGRPVGVEGRTMTNGLQLDVRDLAPGTYLLHTAAGVARFVKW